MKKLIKSFTQTILLLAFIIAICYFAGLICGIAKADEIAYHKIPTDTIVKAIWATEGGNRAQYAYGIRSIKYKSYYEAYRIALNSIRNNKKRFAKQNKEKDFIIFMARRFCPQGCENDRGTNRYWEKNVKHHIKKIYSEKKGRNEKGCNNKKEIKENDM